ncbi:MAG TPA: alpha/beta fold hydrolase [Alphaproteobacteria bacterium]|nr:alpha/beta fold hydrolase [Alphaproteobacteria bacterium]
MAKIDLKNKKTKTIILVGAFILLVIFFLGFLRLNFMVGEQLRMTISPEYIETTVVSPGTLKIEVDVKVYNKFVCEATCNYVLADLSSNKLIDSGSFTSKAFKNEQYTKDIFLDQKGYGSRLYLYKIQCTNEYSSLCPVQRDSLVRKSLVVASYTPDSAQLSALEYSTLAYNQTLSNYIQASRLHSGTGEIISLLNLPVNTSQYHSIDSELSSLSDTMNNAINVWDSQDLLATKSYIDSNNLVSRSASLLTKVSSYNSNVVSIAKNHNSLVQDLSVLRNKMLDYSKALLIPEQLSGITSNNNPSNSPNASASIKFNITKTISDYNVLIYYISSEYDYSNANATYNKLIASTSTLDSLIYSEISVSIAELSVPLFVHSRIICDSNASKCGDYDESVFLDNSVAGFDSAEQKLMHLCNYSDKILSDTLLQETPNNINQNQSSNQTGNETNSSISSKADSVESLLLQYWRLSEYYSMAPNVYTLNYIDWVKSELLDQHNISDPDSYSNLAINASQVYFNEENILISEIEKITLSCSIWQNLTSLGLDLNVKTLPSNTYNESVLDDPGLYDADISTRPIPEFVPQCCLFGKCQSCEKSPEKNPLIMLHGHAFLEDAHAYRSIEIFNDFEQKFSDDKLYYQSGMLIPSTPSTEGILGRYYLPASIKPTYYLETYNDLLGLTVSESKTTGIDTYALRLKEYIEYTKYMTGSEKVDIVAHSMGGLVVRRYLQIFGDENVGKVILIGTPNHGITERTYAFCKLFGATNECDDMKEGGLFLRKLNDQTNTAVVDEMYLVIGRGCDTDGEDGDGIVVAENSLIKSIPEENILYVQGSCSGTNSLHNVLLDTSKYPEVYWFVKEKLKD